MTILRWLCLLTAGFTTLYALYATFAGSFGHALGWAALTLALLNTAAVTFVIPLARDTAEPYIGRHRAETGL